MPHSKRNARIIFFTTASMAALLLLSSNAVAQSTDVHGVIDGRSGATMTVKSQDTGTNVVVLLTDDTQVEDVEGKLHMRKKQMGLAALVPGLAVEVKGTYNAQNQLVANDVKFKASSLQTARRTFRQASHRWNNKLRHNRSRLPSSRRSFSSNSRR